MYWLAVVAAYLNPDVIIIEAYLMGVCLIVEIVCTFIEFTQASDNFAFILNV